MKNIKVIFHSEDDSGRSFACKFRNENSFYRFLNLYQYVPGYAIFSYDIVCDNCTERLPNLRADDKSFKRVYYGLYPKEK